VAIVLGIFISYGILLAVVHRPPLQSATPYLFARMTVLSLAMTVLGLADDRFSLRPRVKLLGQVVIAALVWCWAGLGFADFWPSLPAGLDCLITVFWIVGAVNAFNLIDGLDGLATGLALIAVGGMAGALFFVQNPQATLFYFAIMGGLLGFLRYNYNPASVFLGDSGSMFIGFVVSTLPLVSHTPNSFLVSIGVPLLAMGVPIFDTFLAILRRSIRHVLARLGTDVPGGIGNDRVMTADSDHLHHRILRAAGMNQKRAAWLLYLFAAAAVLFGLGGVWLQSRAAGLWLLAIALATVVVFREMATVELFDMGRFLTSVAHSDKTEIRRRRAKFEIPFYVCVDLLSLIAAFFLTAWVLRIPLDRLALRSDLPLRVVPTFFALILFHAYRTVWPRAVSSNYVRLFLACMAGSVVGTAAAYLAPMVQDQPYKAACVLYALLAFTGVKFVRIVRGIVRDLFYAIDCARLKARKDVSRVLVYGAGLRYRSFRRELVRTTAANDRMIVGLLDDDITIRGKRIGGMRVLGTIHEAGRIINEVNADAVVIACDISDEWLGIVRQILAPTGVKITLFSFSEKEV